MPFSSDEDSSFSFQTNFGLDKVKTFQSLYLLLPRGDIMKSLFAKYDRNQMYCFTFRDFLLMRGRLAEPAARRINKEDLFKVSVT